MIWEIVFVWDSELQVKWIFNSLEEEIHINLAFEAK